MGADTPFREVQKAAEREFAKGGAARVDSVHGTESLSVVAKRRDGSVLGRLQVEWVPAEG